jgi:hypothetical protein
LDSTTIGLPRELSHLWIGCGSQQGTNAVLKLQVRWELQTGMLEGPSLQSGRIHDRESPWQSAPLPKGALRLADLGYFQLDLLHQWDQEGVYWLTRIQAGTLLWDAEGTLWDLASFLRAQNASEVDIPIRLGKQERLPCRLLARRVPPDAVAARRRRLHKDAKRRGQHVSQKRLALADWTFFATNVPKENLSLPEAFVLLRLRWQMESLFKLVMEACIPRAVKRLGASSGKCMPNCWRF